MKFPEVSNGNGLSKHFVKIKGGDFIEGVFRGDPVVFYQHWIDGRSQVCTRPDCALCEAGERATFRARFNFVTKENGAVTVKVFEVGRTVFDMLKSINADYPLESNTMKITRHGEGKDTTYSVLPKANGKVNAAFEKAMQALALHDLSPTPKAAATDETTTVEQEADSSGGDEDIPF